MLVILWPNPVDQAIRFEDVFLAEDLLGFLMLRIGSQNFPCDGFVVLSA